MRYKYQLWFLVILLKIYLALADGNVEDYAFLAQQRMKNDIKMSELQVTYVKDTYADLTSIIVDRQQRVHEEMYQADVHLTLMQAINPSYRQCIQRYKSGMYTKEQVQEKFNACLKAADGKAQKMMMDVDAPMNLAKQTANIKLPMAIEVCQEMSNNDTAQGECVVTKVSTEYKTFDGDLDNVQDGMEINLGLIYLVTRKAMECSFEVEKRVLANTGSTLQLIDRCLEDMHLPAISTMMYN